MLFRSKTCLIIPIKKEHREEYVSLHENPWMEMLKAIKDAGFTNEVIYYHNDQSIIFLECEDFEAANSKLRASLVCKKWDALVCPWFSADPIFPAKIFDLNQQLHGQLLQD